MLDPRLQTLAEVLIDHSCRIQSGEKILIEAFDLPEPTLVNCLIETTAQRGAHPFVIWKDNQILRTLYRCGDETAMAVAGKWERNLMEQMDAYVGVRGAENSNELGDVPSEKMKLRDRVWWKPVHLDVRVPKTRWVVLRYPTPSMAQAAHMSTAAFEKFYFDVCTADYARMSRDQAPLVKRMEAAETVRVTAPGTDLEFSIKGMPVIPCAGENNIPDGEVFTAPLRDSVQGTMRYNTPSLKEGTVFENIEFVFENGKIVKASAGGQTERLNQILDSDEGARYIGEWSLGCNNRVRKPMLDTLFDEKIGGSMHLTPGNAYDAADNGNRSQVHWDIVLMQTPEAGGGELYFDGELVRKDGFFVPDDLKGLNAGLESSV
ncbi:MAG: aminopeptidase [Planctomycetales bacterium]